MLLPVLGVFTNHRVDLMKKKKKKVSFYISFVQSGGKLLRTFQEMYRIV